MPTVLVTGASRGIGLALARSYADAGWSVLAACRDPDGARTRLAHSCIQLERLDVIDAASINALTVRLASTPLDVVVSSAGVTWRDTPVGGFDYARWREVMEVNLYGAVRVIEALLPNLKAGEQGKAVAISSSLGSLTLGGGGNAFYRSSKAALNMAIRSMAADLALQGVTLAVLSPGFVDTDLTRGIAAHKVSAADSAEGLRHRIETLQPLCADGFRRYNGDLVPW